ncbi:MAG: hypothetical protein WBC13_06385 [Dokdonella sp.]
MFEVTIYLKNGNKFTVFANEFKVQRTVSGAFSGLEWTNGAKEQERLMYVDMNDISAITRRPTLREPDGTCDCGHAWTAHNENGCCWDDDCDCTQPRR